MIDPDHTSWNRAQFLRMAFFVQGGVLLIACLLLWCFSVPGSAVFRFEWSALLNGLIAVAPLLLLYRFSPNLRGQARQLIGEALDSCHGSDLLGLALLAGVGEELLFRGAVFEALAKYDLWLAIVVSNVGFGALHAVSRNYFLVATLVGLGMHFLADLNGERNLLAPMVAHGVYDWLAFLLLRRHGNGDHVHQADNHLSSN